MIGKKIWLSILLTVGLVTLAWGQSPVTDALEGLDPVMLVQGKEVQGELQFAVTRGGFRYLLANETNKAIFEKDPTRYEIQFGGACARMGAPVTGIADLYTVHQGRIYIFGSAQCKTAFAAAPEKYLPPVSTTSLSTAATPEALKKGQALLAKAVEAMGGAAKMDTLVSYREKSLSVQVRGARGEVEVKNDLLIAFPDRIRLDTEMPDFNNASELMRRSLVRSPSEDFVLTPRGAMPLQALLRAAQEQQLQRQPLLLLRERNSLKPVFIGSGKASDVPVIQVAIELAGAPATLGFDPATGRLLSLSLKQRGPQGYYGDFLQTFSDFRTIDGLTLPFKITATFDGQPWKEQSVTINSITINGGIDAALFERPKKAQ